MQPEATPVAQSVSSRGSLRPAGVGSAVLVALMVIGGIPGLRLAVVELVPAAALVEGIRMPAWLPRLGVPFGDGAAMSYWAVETVAALVVVVVFWLRSAAAARQARSRLAVAGQVWLDTVLAVLAGCLVYAVLSSFLTADRPLPYLLLVGGVSIFGVLWGALSGLLTAAAASAVARA